MRLFGRHRSARPPLLARVATLAPAEAQWRDRNVEVSRRLVRRYSLGTTARLPSVEQLQAVVEAWRADEDPDVGLDALVNAVGMAFGANLAAVAQLTWVLTIDDDGIELALHADRDDVLVHPARAVSRYVAADDGSTLCELHEELLVGIGRRSLQVEAPEPSRARPPSRSA